MKVLTPAVTVIVVSHLKPYLADELDSLLAQTRQDIHILVVDSGQWLSRIDSLAATLYATYTKYARHPLVEWVTTGEPPDLRRHRCPVAWATNEAIRAGLVRGRYVAMGYDDDTHAPTFAERMAGYLDEHPDAMAVWCSQRRVMLDTVGTEREVPGITADSPRYPSTWDCQVDGAQVMFRRELLDKIGDPWLPEDPAEASCRHSDGVFLDRLGDVAGVVPNISEPLVTHRFTPLSAYTPST